MRKRLLIGALAVGLITPLALFAQSITNRSLNGTTTFEGSINGPGGTLQDVTAAQLRNATGVATTAATTGTYVSTTSTATLVSTAASVSLTVDLPPKPYDGEIFEWLNGSAGAFTAGTIAVTDGSTIVNGSTAGTLAAGASIEYRYVLSTNSWYRMR